jgi:hypothetical protein
LELCGEFLEGGDPFFFFLFVFDLEVEVLLALEVEEGELRRFFGVFVQVKHAFA